MDPQLTTAAAAVIESPHSHTHSLPPLPTHKIRLMCSYNGHIIPRPQTKSLCYAGGETRIVAVDRRTTASTITSLTHHLSRTLYNNRPFTLKYQLPNEDLDSLVSITTDEDLQNMLEEHDRIVTSPTPSRIRLFLFPTRPESTGSILLDPKSETWFSDALKSSMIINRGLSDGSGIGLDCMNGNGDSGDSRKCGSGSVQESMVLETCSSFGSINSSVNNEDGGGGGNLDKKVKVPVNGLIESDNSGRIYHDQVIQVLSDSESIIYNPSSTVHMQRNVQVSGFQIQQIPDQRQQPVQYIQTGSPHNIQYPTGPIPMPSYNPMYVPYHHHQQQQQQLNQPYPIYVMPMGPTDQSYNMSAPVDLNGNVTRHPLHTHITNFHVATVVPQVTPSNIVPSRSAQPMGPITTPTTPTYENEYDNDLAYAQIYKSQPSAPVFPPQKLETMKKTEPVPLSDSSVGTS